MIAGVVPLLLWMTAVDGARVAQSFAFGQTVATLVCAVYWLALCAAASRRLRLLMVVGVGVAALGEAIFSLGLGMYEYRQHAIPLYVPPGHTVLYAAVFLWVRLPGIRRRAALLLPALLALGATYSVLSWRLFDDDYGLVCSLVFVALLIAIRGSRLFFAAMYLLVGWLEQVGTASAAWAWPSHLLGRAHGLSSANPPSGVAVFYCLFDLGCLALYFALRFTHFERWVQRLVWKRNRPKAAQW